MPITIQVPKIRLNFDEIGDIVDPHLKIDPPPSDTDTRKDETLKLESHYFVAKNESYYLTKICLNLKNI